MEDIKEVLKSICVTDEDVKNVVKNIREDIVPKFSHVQMVGEKILVRRIFIKENEKTKAGILIIEGATKNIDQNQFYSTHPFQAVVIATGEDKRISSGDHILCKNEIPEQLNRGGVVIGDYIFSFIHFTDIICKL